MLGQSVSIIFLPLTHNTGRFSNPTHCTRKKRVLAARRAVGPAPCQSIPPPLISLSFDAAATRDGERERMADSRSEIAERYASAFFELVQEEGKAETAERDLDALRQAFDDSEDLRRLIQSPAFGAEAKTAGIAAVLEGKADPLTVNFMKLLASNGRLSLLLSVIRRFKEIAAEARGEVSAQVISAHPLSDDQVSELKTQIRASVGKDVTLDTSTDPELLGGLIVKIGSRMIDSSLKTKLARLRARLKEA